MHFRVLTPEGRPTEPQEQLTIEGASVWAPTFGLRSRQAYVWREFLLSLVDAMDSVGVDYGARA
jgi:hypothetical protein